MTFSVSGPVLNVWNPTGSGSTTLFLAQDSRNKTKPRFACTYNTSICRSCHFFYFPDPDPALYVKTDLDSCGKTDADPLVRGMDPRIWIRTKMSRIRNIECNVQGKNLTVESILHYITLNLFPKKSFQNKQICETSFYIWKKYNLHSASVTTATLFIPLLEYCFPFFFSIVSSST